MEACLLGATTFISPSFLCFVVRVVLLCATAAVPAQNTDSTGPTPSATLQQQHEEPRDCRICRCALRGAFLGVRRGDSRTILVEKYDSIRSSLSQKQQQ